MLSTSVWRRVMGCAAAIIQPDQAGSIEGQAQLLPHYPVRARPIPAHRGRSRCAGAVRAGLVLGALALVGGCQGAALDLELDQAAASAEDLGELLERVKQLEAEQADQAARLAEAEAALGECIQVAEVAGVNAAAAQERSAELRTEIDSAQLWDRLAEAEADLGTLWAAVEALYR